MTHANYTCPNCWWANNRVKEVEEDYSDYSSDTRKPVVSVSVDIQEWRRLQDENEKLKKEISELNISLALNEANWGDFKKLSVEKEALEKTNEKLKAENDQLRNTICEMTTLTRVPKYPHVYDPNCDCDKCLLAEAKMHVINLQEANENLKKANSELASAAIAKSERKPHKCPVCDGKGVVEKPVQPLFGEKFHVDIGCAACKNGVVWEPK